MSVRNFDGTNDVITCALGNCNQTGALTVAAIIRRNSAGAWHCIMANHNSSNAYQWEFGFAADTDLNQAVFYSTAQARGSRSVTTFTSTTTWYLIVFTKPAGVSDGRWHIYTFGTGWAHSAGASAGGTPFLGNPATQAGGTVKFGEADGVDDLNARIAVAGQWTSELSDAQCENLTDGLTTAAWVNHAVTPAAVWQFNQESTGTNVEDLVGTSDQTAITGTSVVADDPPGWTYDGGAVWPPVDNPAAPPLRVARSNLRLG